MTTWPMCGPPDRDAQAKADAADRARRQPIVITEPPAIASPEPPRVCNDQAHDHVTSRDPERWAPTLIDLDAPVIVALADGPGVRDLMARAWDEGRQWLAEQGGDVSTDTDPYRSPPVLDLARIRRAVGLPE